MTPLAGDATLNRAKAFRDAGQLNEAVTAYREAGATGNPVALRNAALIGLVETLRIAAISRSAMDAFRDEAGLPSDDYEGLSAIDPAIVQASEWTSLQALYADVFATGNVSLDLAIKLLIDLRTSGNDDAVKTFAAAMPPSGPIAMFQAMTTLRKGDHATGGAQLTRALQAMPHSVSGRRLQGEERWREGRGSRAAVLFEIALAFADNSYRGIWYAGPEPVALDEDFMGWRIGFLNPLFIAERKTDGESPHRLEANDLETLLDSIEGTAGPVGNGL